MKRQNLNVKSKFTLIATRAAVAIAFGGPVSFVLNAHATPGQEGNSSNPSIAAEKSAPPIRDEVLFTSTRHGHMQIYKRMTNGTEVRLNPSDSADLQPTWSRNGKIAFVSYRTGQGDIYVMNADGGELHRLTSRNGLEQQPAWSPNGQHLAFTGETDGKVRIFVINADGTGERDISQKYSEAASPTWSPDGRHVAFVASVNGKMRLVLWNTESDSTRLVTTAAEANERDPVWSPDSKTILFTLNGKNAEGINLASANVSTGDVRKLTRNMYINSSAAWSPDGSKISFLSNADTQGGTMNLNLMNADGTHPINLTQSEAQDLAPAWSSDGKHIYFMSFRQWPGQVFVIGADGANLTRISTSNGQDGFPVPRPQISSLMH